MMALTIYANWAPKSGHHDAEYEDAFAFCCEGRTPKVLDHTYCRIAIADGATDSWCSGRWAKLLVGAAVRGRLRRSRFADQFHQLRERWRRRAVPPDLNWVSEEKARGGAHAAVLSVVIRSSATPGGGGLWSAWAIGDCCLFQFRAGRLVTGFPYTRPEQFTFNPLLMGTSDDATTVASRYTGIRGKWEPGDEFVLATDALALWVLEQLDQAGTYDEAGFAEATRPKTRAEFADWVRQARESGRLRNDDTTLVSLRPS